jgi:RNA ligase
MEQIYKYPRTPHIRGSRLQAGDEDLADMPLDALKGKHIVIEEKLDGANCAISFGYNGLQLQSRGHFLSGGPRERQFDLLKTWANVHVQAFQEILGERYVMYGEWLYAKHTVFYNALRHYFLEFDILDLETMQFLDTPRRQEILRSLPMVQSMPVVYSGPTPTMKEFLALIGDSEAIVGDHVADLRRVAESLGQRAEQVVAETATAKTMEGLYLKVEENGVVTARYKYVRAGFVQALVASESHWMDRPILPNQLKPGIDIFAG